MDKAEVSQLLKKIKRRYPTFQLPADLAELRAMIDEWREDLQSTPIEVAVENLRRHSDSGEDWPPSIGKLKRPLQTEADLYHDRMRDSAKEHMSNLDEFERTADPPPDEIRAIFRLPDEERTEALREYVKRARIN